MAQNLKYYSFEKGAPKTKRFDFVRDHGELKLFEFANDPTEHSYAWVQVSEDSVLLPGWFTFGLLDRKPGFVPETVEGWKSEVKKSLSQRAKDGYKLPYFAAEFGFTDEEVAQSESEYTERKAKEKAGREAKREQRLKEEAEKEAKHAAEVKQKVLEGEYIAGDDLVDLSRSLGLEVHPRTVGMIRDRVGYVKHDSAKVTGKGLPNNRVYNLYRSCHRILSEQNSAA